MAGGYGPPGGGHGGYGGYGGHGGPAAPPPFGPPGAGGPPHGPPGFGAPPPGGPPPLMPGAGGDVNTKAPFVAAVVATLLCCNVLFGVPAMLFALQAGNAMKAGDIPTARSKVKVSWIVLVLGLVVQAAVVAYHFATNGFG